MNVPHNPELEQMMIGTALVDKTLSWEAKLLTAADFYIGVNRAIWSAICELAEAGESIEIGAVFSRLTNWPIKLSDLTRMAVGIPIQTSCAAEVNTLRNLTALRTLQKGFSNLAGKAEDCESVDEIVEQAEGLLSAVRAHKEIQGTSKTLAEVYEHEVFPMLDKFVAGEGSKIPFGWEPLDISTNGGAGVGELVVFGAKPKSGKSGFMLQVARSQAERGIATYICSREMLNFENGFRSLAQTSSYTVNHFRAGLFERTAASIKEHGRETGHIPLRFDDRSKTVKEIRAELSRLEDAGGKITSAFVDYVQLIRSPKRHNSTADMIEDIIYDLKDLAIEREMVVYVNAQFNRDGIDAQRPKMSDFKGSSAIEMAANIVLLWTLEQDVDPVERARKGELWIEAGRNVAYDEFPILFYGEKALFVFR